MPERTETADLSRLETLLRELEERPDADLDRIEQVLSLIPAESRADAVPPPPLVNRERTAEILERLKFGAPPADLPPAVRSVWLQFEETWLTAENVQRFTEELGRLEEPVKNRKKEQSDREREIETTEQRIEALTSLSRLLDSLLQMLPEEKSA